MPWPTFPNPFCRQFSTRPRDARFGPTQCFDDNQSTRPNERRNQGYQRCESLAQKPRKHHDKTEKAAKKTDFEGVKLTGNVTHTGRHRDDDQCRGQDACDPAQRPPGGSGRKRVCGHANHTLAGTPGLTGLCQRSLMLRLIGFARHPHRHHSAADSATDPANSSATESALSMASRPSRSCSFVMINGGVMAIRLGRVRV